MAEVEQRKEWKVTRYNTLEHIIWVKVTIVNP